jgi:hypothetical protein
MGRADSEKRWYFLRMKDESVLQEPGVESHLRGSLQPAFDHARLGSRGQGPREVAVRAGEQDALAVGRDGAVLNDGQVTLIQAAPRRAAGAGDQLADVPDDEQESMLNGKCQMTKDPLGPEQPRCRKSFHECVEHGLNIRILCVY